MKRIVLLVTVVLVMFRFVIGQEVLPVATPEVVVTPTPEVEIVPTKPALVLTKQNDMRGIYVIPKETNIFSSTYPVIKTNPGQPSKQKPDPCSVTLTVEVGADSSHLDKQLGEEFYSKPAGNVNNYLEICGEKKVSYFLNTWSQKGLTKSYPNGAEQDVSGGVNVQLNDTTKVGFEAGTYFFPEGSINFFQGSVNYETEFLDEQTIIGLESSVSYNQTSKRLNSKSGWISSHGLVFTRSFQDEALKVSVSPYISFDNNLYDYGSKKLAMNTGLEGKISAAVAPNLEVFAGFLLTRNVFGRYENNTHISGRIGFAYTIKLR